MSTQAKPFPINTESQAQRYLDAVADVPWDWACPHGHHGCAAWENGPCSDEIASEFNLIKGDE
jgi:hypothetical protein